MRYNHILFEFGRWKRKFQIMAGHDILTEIIFDDEWTNMIEEQEDKGTIDQGSSDDLVHLDSSEIQGDDRQAVVDAVVEWLTQKGIIVERVAATSKAGS